MMDVGWEVSSIPICMIEYHCTDSYPAISFRIQDFMPDEVGTSLRRSVTATSALPSAECQCHMSSISPWLGAPKVRLYLYLSRLLTSLAPTNEESAWAQ
jgi:hypothetical protein